MRVFEGRGNFLGHKISEQGVEPDTRKVEAIRDFPTPKTAKQLKNFLGLAGYYRRFVPRFSKIADPLHKLLKKDSKYDWGRSGGRISRTKAETDVATDLTVPRFLKGVYIDY